MHPQAAAWINDALVWHMIGVPDVLDLGGKTVWGNQWHADKFNSLTIVDLQPGPDVDIVADAADWEPDREYGLVLCTEVFEHTPRWRDIVRTAYKALRPHGLLIATCARDDRPPHSAVDGGPLRAGEYYENVPAMDLWGILACLGWHGFKVYEADGHFGNDDLYCWAQK